MKRIIFTFILMLSLPAMGKLAKADWEVKAGALTYHVSYPLKKVIGVAKNVKGKGHCEAGSCQFLVAVPLKDFQSGDGNRDNHMLEVTKAGTNPMVMVNVKFADSVNAGDQIDAKAEITFAGKSHVYDHITIKSSASGAQVITSGTVPLVLSDFSVERPSLLAIKVDDAAPVDFEITWN